ncbi:hypothetical protein EVAR_45376_1 [Eumeta japonica]|uniref:Uncharacterized protein n=1 Tax=Eumeta variegata TaxID=151549 RepID=A0A4C1XWW3_EUMVA|nr:hypothetical protein EVAR_45376_1 [Eumeta japonica]
MPLTHASQPRHARRTGRLAYAGLLYVTSFTRLQRVQYGTAGTQEDLLGVFILCLHAIRVRFGKLSTTFVAGGVATSDTDGLKCSLRYQSRILLEVKNSLVDLRTSDLTRYLPTLAQRADQAATLLTYYSKIQESDPFNFVAQGKSSLSAHAAVGAAPGRGRPRAGAGGRRIAPRTLFSKSKAITKSHKEAHNQRAID